MYRKLTEAECRDAMKHGEFSQTIVSSKPSVAIVLTQSWCPQWGWMRSYLPALADSPDTDIYWLEYDQEPLYDAFLDFKEDHFGNREIPYVRYYHHGKLVKESNYIDKAGFLRMLKN